MIFVTESTASTESGTAAPTNVETLKKHYDGYYAEDAQIEWRRLGARDKAQNLIALTKDVPHDSILEVGAGNGAVLAELDRVAFGDELSAVELSQSGAQEIEARKLPHLKEVKCYDGSDLPYEDQTFDLVVLSHVLEHVESERPLLRELKRVGRHVFIEVPLEYTWRLPQDFRWTSTGHINPYSPRLIRWLLGSSGLKILNARITNPGLPVYQYQLGRFRGGVQWALKESLLRVAPGLATRIFCYHFAALCVAPADETP